MATTNYGFPTIQSTDKINGVSAINGLANAVDTALKTVDDKASGGEAYELPPATTSTLGGVIVGDNLTVDGAGKISAGAPYALPAATPVRLGGVKPSTGLTVSGDGTLTVNATWLAQQIENAISAYVTENFATGTTWGDIETHGFAYTGTE